MQKKIVVFDTETNGLNDCSVLSVSAIKILVDLELNSCKKIKKFNRFYFRNKNEKINEEAIKINKLTDEKISFKRQGKKYPEYFEKDNGFEKFCKDTEYFVAHNIDFDSKFLSFELKNKFCTQKSNINIVKKESGTEGKYKYPSLMETAEFYNIKLDRSQWHGSEYDTYICKEIFMAMLKNKETSEIIIKFLEGEKNEDSRKEKRELYNDTQ